MPGLPARHVARNGDTARLETCATPSVGQALAGAFILPRYDERLIAGFTVIRIANRTPGILSSLGRLVANTGNIFLGNP